MKYLLSLLFAFEVSAGWIYYNKTSGDISGTFTNVVTFDDGFRYQGGTDVYGHWGNAGMVSGLGEDYELVLTTNDLAGITNISQVTISPRPTLAMEQSLTNHVQDIVLLLNTIPSPPFDTLALAPPYPAGTRQNLAALAEAASNIFTNQEDKIRLNSLSVFAVMEMFSLHEDGVETDNNADLGK